MEIEGCMIYYGPALQAGRGELIPVIDFYLCRNFVLHFFLLLF